VKTLKFLLHFLTCFKLFTLKTKKWWKYSKFFAHVFSEKSVKNSVGYSIYDVCCSDTGSETIRRFSCEGISRRTSHTVHANELQNTPSADRWTRRFSASWIRSRRRSGRASIGAMTWIKRNQPIILGTNQSRPKSYDGDGGSLILRMALSGCRTG
jgi:hypothetical protein